MKVETKTLAEACTEASNAFVNLHKALSSESMKENRSILEKFIDWASYKLFGNKSCMPNELKSFR